MRRAGLGAGTWGAARGARGHNLRAFPRKVLKIAGIAKKILKFKFLKCGSYSLLWLDFGVGGGLIWTLAFWPGAATPAVSTLDFIAFDKIAKGFENSLCGGRRFDCAALFARGYSQGEC